MGNVGSKVHCEGFDYAISVEETGVFIDASNEKNLIYGFMTLIDLIKIDENKNVYIPCCEIKEKAKIKNRMIHFCLFPETEFWELEKFIRFCGALKYSHIVLEFWGMLKYDCFKEIAWENAFEKSKIKPLINLANDLGIEIIPMFNHWGHASQSRQMHGKHVVLDKEPKLAYLFSEDGWRWNIKSKSVRELFKSIRRELIELCGNGKYFHIGCDEASGFDYSDKEMDEVADFINEVNEDIVSMGRKTIMWADMLLYRCENFNKNNIYIAQAPSEKSAEYLLNKLDKSIIMADWQYDSKEFPVETAVKLKNSDRETFLCSWDRSFENIQACIDTIKKYDLDGVLHTTWHTLSNGTVHIGLVAGLCWESENLGIWYELSSKMGAVVRKSFFAKGNYEKSGWAKQQIGVIV